MRTLLLAGAALLLVSRLEARRVATVTGAVMALLVWPPLALGMLAAVGIQRRWGADRRRERPDPMAPVEVAHLVAIGVAAGLTAERVLSFCAQRGPPELRLELVEVLRQARLKGIAAAASGHDGRLAPLLAVISGALRSGAPIEPMVRSHADDARAAVAARRITRARKLPAALAVPLALLLLPGFVLMVMGPAVVEIAVRMLAPVAGG